MDVRIQNWVGGDGHWSPKGVCKQNQRESGKSTTITDSPTPKLESSILNFMLVNLDMLFMLKNPKATSQNQKSQGIKRID